MLVVVIIVVLGQLVAQLIATNNMAGFLELPIAPICWFGTPSALNAGYALVSKR